MNAVTERLRSLFLTDYETDDRSERQALKELTKDIEKLAPMAHPQLRNDFHKRSFLENVVKDRLWALMVSANIMRSWACHMSSTAPHLRNPD